MDPLLSTKANEPLSESLKAPDSPAHLKLHY